MWVAREKNNSLFLYTIKPTRGEKYWYADEGINGYTDLDYCLCISSELFPDLKWEDEPIEVKIVETNPLHKKTCPHCHKEIKYHCSDIKSGYDCQPASSGYDIEYNYIQCPECNKYIDI